MAGGQGGADQRGDLGGTGGTGYQGQSGSAGATDYSSTSFNGGGGGGGGAGGGDGGRGGGLVNNSGGRGGTGGTAGTLDGAAGASGSGSGAGGGGGQGGFHAFTGLSFDNVTTLIGGSGGRGGSPSYSSGPSTGGGGGGGAGGYGAVVAAGSTAAAPLPNSNSGTIAGGAGGSGGLASTSSASIPAGGGNGGDGGIAAFFAGNNVAFTNSAGGSLTGGMGGDGGAGSTIAGSGGAGGIGASFAGTSATFTNVGTVTGGAGGSAGGIAAQMFGQVVPGAPGAGGAGVVGQGLTINNSGTIAGGTGGGNQADAVSFTGGDNTLNNSGVLTGGIGVTGTVILTGSSSIGNTIHDGANGAGAVIVNGTTQTLTGANTYTGGTTIGANGGTASSTLQLGAPTSAGTGAITFGSMSGTATARLGLDVTAQPANGSAFANTISNFGAGNEINLAGLTNSSVSYNSTNSSITVTGTLANNGRVSESFLLSAPRTTSFTTVSDGQGGTIVRAAVTTTPTNPITPSQPSNPSNPANPAQSGNPSNPASPTQPAPCYVTGTHIRVLRGRAVSDVPVEHLMLGDLAITAGGKPRPIRWIGIRVYLGSTVPQSERPVRIRAGALADGMPSSDLLVSPDHCLLLDGLFVAAGHLVNGTSITRGEAVLDLVYWHIELDTHDLLLAENTPAESFLAAPGVRAGFDGVQALNAGMKPVPVAPRAELGLELAALRGRLALRGYAFGVGIGEAASLGAVQAWLDRCAVRSDGLLHVAGWAQDEARTDVPVCLDIVVDGQVVAFAVANEYRPDIAAAGVGNGRHGFDLGLNVALTPGETHEVEVRRSADGLTICAKRVDPAGVWTALLAA